MLFKNGDCNSATELMSISVTTKHIEIVLSKVQFKASNRSKILNDSRGKPQTKI